MSHKSTFRRAYRAARQGLSASHRSVVKGAVALSIPEIILEHAEKCLDIRGGSDPDRGLFFWYANDICSLSERETLSVAERLDRLNFIRADRDYDWTHRPKGSLLPR